MSVRPHPLQHITKHRDKWIIDYVKEDGSRARLQFRGTESDALSLENSLRVKLKKPTPKICPSLLEVAPLFKASYKLDHQPSGVERMYRSLKIILHFFGRYQFQSISPELVEQYRIARITAGVKPTTVNKELSALSGLCKWAEDKGYIKEPIRIRRFPPKLTKAPIMDVPTREEILRVLRAIPRKKRPIFCAMYFLGLRSQEARTLQPNHVKWSRGLVVVTGKGNKQRSIPINRKVAPYLRHSLPFCAPKDFRQILFWACKRARLNRDINPHLFRHAFGMRMTEGGAGLRALQEMMGHSTPIMTERYSQVLAATLIKEMEKF